MNAIINAISQFNVSTDACSKFPDRKRINRLTSKGKALALLALRMKSFFDMKLPEKELQENKLWVKQYRRLRW